MNQHLRRLLSRKKQKHLVNGISSVASITALASGVVEVYIRVSTYSGILFDGLGQ